MDTEPGWSEVIVTKSCFGQDTFVALRYVTNVYDLVHVCAKLKPLPYEPDSKGREKVDELVAKAGRWRRLSVVRGGAEERRELRGRGGESSSVCGTRGGGKGGSGQGMRRGRRLRMRAEEVIGVALSKGEVSAGRREQGRWLGSPKRRCGL
ncbi:uncharacterized protein A4U43_C02F9860 [Asparagus officinalis]|uniref:Uncharacterized protein n=1 Tax=Asparagus officinalis TaxID=4686 RepID=A0A5P1FM22_ASPOF|nr:uncharacterized protein A4U43_C02F9860 [Asparagus officinalis]